MRYRPHLLLIVLTFGVYDCQNSTQDFSALACINIDDCLGDEVCFLGSCVNPGFSFNELYAEITPPNNSTYLPQQLPNTIQLNAGKQHLTLAPPVRFSGQIVEPTTPLQLTGSLHTTSDGFIPGRPIVREILVSQTGFDATMMPGDYDVVFVPDISFAELPSHSYFCGAARLNLQQDLQQDLTYPPPIESVVVEGRLLYNLTQLQSVVAGASIRGLSYDATCDQTLASTTTTSDAEGRFILAFPPGTETFSIEVKPLAGSNTQIPEKIFGGLSTSQLNSGLLPDLSLEVASPVATEIVVHGWDNGVATEAVADAEITVVGLVGSASEPGIYTTTLRTNPQGSTGNVNLIPGEYTITVAPLVAGPYARGRLVQTLTNGGTIELFVPLKVLVEGTLYSADSNPVTGAKILASLQELDVRREFRTTTDDQGRYSLLVDPGETTDAIYEFSIEPKANSGLPRHREFVSLSGSTTQDFHLYRPTFVFGDVRLADQKAAAQAIIAFYSLELSANGTPLLVGLTQTNDDGEFVLPVPTINP